MGENTPQGWTPVRLTQALVRIGALSGAETEVADLAARAMTDLGFAVERDAMGNAVGLVGPAGAPVRLLFDGHLDVVPASGTWARDPFSGAHTDGRIHGRGTTDMKGPLAAAICGVARAAREGRLAHRVAVSATVLEEVIEGVALGHVLDAIPAEAVVICEPSDLQLKIAQRGCTEILVHAEGIPAHAAYPERGRNAIELAARAVSALAALPLPRDPLLGPMVLVATDIISDPYPSTSALPARVSLRYDRRTGTAESSAQILAQIRATLTGIHPEGFTVELSRARYRTPGGLTFEAARDLPAWKLAPDAPLLRAAQGHAARLGLDPAPGVWDFCTNGSESAGRRGLPTLGFGPGRPQDAHVIDESIEVAALEKAADFYAALAAHPDPV